jgi:hypothetical protein
MKVWAKVLIKPWTWQRSVKMMLNKLNFEDRIKQELTTKAREVEISDLMLDNIMNRVKNDAGGDRSILKDKFQTVIIRKWIAVSLAAVLIIGGVMFTFSPDVRAATMGVINTIKTIFVLDKFNGEYKIVETTTDKEFFSPSVCRTTILSDAELTSKMGFNLTFPKTLYGDYKLENKAEGVGINKKVSNEICDQLQPDMFKSIDDESVFNSLSQYNPYRNTFATYDKEGNTISVSIWSLNGAVPEVHENAGAIVETSVGEAKALWIELVSASYKHVTDNGVGKADLYTKPNGISTKHILTWDYNGVRYEISPILQSELTMQEAVKIAESFMAEQ